MRNCSDCPNRPRSAFSDVCDSCTSDPDTGWGGFTDHSVNKHFNTDLEQQEFYMKLCDEEDDDD